MADKPSLALPRSESQRELAQQWRLLARTATLVAVLTSPAIFLWLRKFEGWSIGWSIFATFVAVAAFRANPEPGACLRKRTSSRPWSAESSTS